MNLTEKYNLNEILYKEVICPVCGQVTLDNFFICENCNWEYDDIVDENEYSGANSGTIRDYKEKMGLLHTPNLRFNILPQNLSDFTECIDIIKNENGLVSFNMQDFEKVVMGSKRVDFLVSSGESFVDTVNNFYRYISDDTFMGGNMMLIITSNDLTDDVAEAVNTLCENYTPPVMIYNVYERQQTEKYKAYLFATIPSKNQNTGEYDIY